MATSKERFQNVAVAQSEIEPLPVFPRIPEAIKNRHPENRIYWEQWEREVEQFMKKQKLG